MRCLTPTFEMLALTFSVALLVLTFPLALTILLAMQCGRCKKKKVTLSYTFLLPLYCIILSILAAVAVSKNISVGGTIFFDDN